MTSQEEVGKEAKSPYRKRNYGFDNPPNIKYRRKKKFFTENPFEKK